MSSASAVVASGSKKTIEQHKSEWNAMDNDELSKTLETLRRDAYKRNIAMNNAIKRGITTHAVHTKLWQDSCLLRDACFDVMKSRGIKKRPSDSCPAALSSKKQKLPLAPAMLSSSSMDAHVPQLPALSSPQGNRSSSSTNCTLATIPSVAPRQDASNSVIQLQLEVEVLKKRFGQQCTDTTPLGTQLLLKALQDNKNIASVCSRLEGKIKELQSDAQEWETKKKRAIKKFSHMTQQIEKLQKQLADVQDERDGLFGLAARSQQLEDERDQLSALVDELTLENTGLRQAR